MKKSKNMANQAKAAKTRGPKATPATASDLTLTLSDDGLVVTTTISPEAQWAGIQKASDANGADLASVGNWSFSQPPGAGATKSVPVTGPGYYRGWSSDFDYDIHVSAFVQVS